MHGRVMNCRWPLDKLYSLTDKVRKCGDDHIKKDGNTCSQVTTLLYGNKVLFPTEQSMHILILMKHLTMHS